MQDDTQAPGESLGSSTEDSHETEFTPNRRRFLAGSAGATLSLLGAGNAIGNSTAQVLSGADTETTDSEYEIPAGWTVKGEILCENADGIEPGRNAEIMVREPGGDGEVFASTTATRSGAYELTIPERVESTREPVVVARLLPADVVRDEAVGRDEYQHVRGSAERLAPIDEESPTLDFTFWAPMKLLVHPYYFLTGRYSGAGDSLIDVFPRIRESSTRDDDEFHAGTWEELEVLHRLDPGKHIELISDIRCYQESMSRDSPSMKPLTPIASTGTFDSTTGFYGSIDGRGHAITHLAVREFGSAGFIGELTPFPGKTAPSIRNITFKAPYIESLTNDRAGVVAGGVTPLREGMQNPISIENVHVTGLDPADRMESPPIAGVDAGDGFDSPTIAGGTAGGLIGEFTPEAWVESAGIHFEDVSVNAAEITGLTAGGVLGEYYIDDGFENAPRLIFENVAVESGAISGSAMGGVAGKITAPDVTAARDSVVRFDRVAVTPDVSLEPEMNETVGGVAGAAVVSSLSMSECVIAPSIGDTDGFGAVFGAAGWKSPVSISAVYYVSRLGDAFAATDGDSARIAGEGPTRVSGKAMTASGALESGRLSGLEASEWQEHSSGSPVPVSRS